MMELKIKREITSCSLGYVFKDMFENHRAKGQGQMFWDFKELGGV